METISRERAMALVSKWHASPRMKRDAEAVSARKVPRGRFIFREKDGSVGALDNSKGRCRVENFESLVAATEWMMAED